MPTKGTKKRTLQEERQWLSLYEEGKPIDQISTDAHRSVRTTWRGIERASQERDMRRVRDSILRNAFSEHFQDLQGMLQTVRQRTSMDDVETLQPNAEQRTELLMQSLFEHSRRSPLKEHWSAWEKAAKVSHFLENELRSTISSFVKTALAGRWSGVVNSEGFIGSLAHIVNLRTSGASDPQYEPVIERDNDGMRLAWGAWTLANGLPSDEEALEVLSIHISLREEVLRQRIVSDIRASVQNWGQRHKALELDIETLLLRRVFPGTCSLCPR